MLQSFVPTRQPIALPGTSLLGLDALNLVELGDAVQKGFQPVAVDRFAKHLNLTLGETLGLVQLSESTFHTYKRNPQVLHWLRQCHLR